MGLLGKVLPLQATGEGGGPLEIRLAAPGVASGRAWAGITCPPIRGLLVRMLAEESYPSGFQPGKKCLASRSAKSGCSPSASQLLQQTPREGSQVVQGPEEQGRSSGQTIHPLAAGTGRLRPSLESTPPN